MTRTYRKQPPHPRGLALIEVMLCSTIAAMMLTATAVAFRASVMTYRDNTDRNTLVSQGRVAMRQMITDIRQSDIQAPTNVSMPNATTLFAQGQTVECDGIQLLKQHPDADDPAASVANPVEIIWQYDSTHKQITRSRLVGVTTTTNVWASYVQTLAISQTPARSTQNIAQGISTYDLLYRAVVTMTLQNVNGSGAMINDQGTTLVTERLVDAAVPRRNFSDIR